MMTTKKGDLLALIDWWRLQEIIRKKDLTHASAPIEYEELLKDYIVKLIIAGNLTTISIHKTHISDLFFVQKLEKYNIDQFERFIYEQRLEKILLDELSCQLLPFKDVLESSCLEEYFSRFIRSDKNITFTQSPIKNSQYIYAKLYLLMISTMRRFLAKSFFPKKLRVLLSYLYKKYKSFFHKLEFIIISEPIFINKKSKKEVAYLLYKKAEKGLKESQYNYAYALLHNSFSLGYRPLHMCFLMAETARQGGDYLQAECLYKANLFFLSKICRAESFFYGALVFLSIGKEIEAIWFLKRAQQEDMGFSMAHQNMADRCERSQYKPQFLDLLLQPSIMLYDAYNLAAGYALHIGLGAKAMELNGIAIQHQYNNEIKKIPQEVLYKLEQEYSFDPEKPLRILPYEWITQIGHIGGLLDSYLKLQHLDIIHANHQILLLAPDHKVANKSYLSLWKKHLIIIKDPYMINIMYPFQRYFGDSFNAYLKQDGTYGDWTELGSKAQIAWDKAGYEPLVQLSQEIREKGRFELMKMGIKEGDWFVCVHARDCNFYQEEENSMQAHRNSPITDYIEAIRFIVKQGGWVIRMGDHNMESLPFQMERVIDYAHSSFKKPYMDVFLAATAKFFIGTTSGLTNMFISFGTPCLLVNCISNNFQLWNHSVLFMVKPLWMKERQRYMTFAEMTSEKFRWSMFNKHILVERGVIVHNNTSDEILAATIEILSKLKNKNYFSETKADFSLHAECQISGNQNYFGHGRLSESFFQNKKHELFHSYENE